jgi:EAL domain-containing protein (putative c-di-GMP-specific phosphodiesterase class I)
VIDTALTQASEWHARRLIDEDFDIAVNVSARQLIQDDFAARLLTRLERHALPPRCFSVEVTESDLLADIDKARGQLAALFQAGVGIAIDDFGTGYSSLAYLQALPVSLLKIDRVFVQGLVSNPHNRHLVKTMIVLARDLGCAIVAEGIENQEQSALLTELGCELGQGYFYAAAQTSEAFSAWYQAC